MASTAPLIPPIAPPIIIPGGPPIKDPTAAPVFPLPAGPGASDLGGPLEDFLEAPDLLGQLTQIALVPFPTLLVGEGQENDGFVVFLGHQ